MDPWTDPAPDPWFDPAMEPWLDDPDGPAPSAEPVDFETWARRYLATLPRCGRYPARCVHEFVPMAGLLLRAGRYYGFRRCRLCGTSERCPAGAA